MQDGIGNAKGGNCIFSEVKSSKTNGCHHLHDRATTVAAESGFRVVQGTTLVIA